MATARTAPRPPAPHRAALDCAAEVIEVMPVVMDAFRAAMRDHIDGGLSVPQFRCLNFVGENPGASVSELAAFMGVTLATASATADRLVRAGWLAADVAASDRRRLELGITTAGRDLLARMRRAAQRDLAARLQALPPEALQRVRDGLAVLREGFSEPTA